MPVFVGQPAQGKNSGFDLYRDPLNSHRPMADPDEIVRRLSADKARIMEAQRQLLERRYNLQPQLDTEAKMSRGKPLPVGPTARLAQGMTWDRLASLSPEEIREQDAFPYPSLPHPLQTNGGQVFPKMQIQMFPRQADPDSRATRGAPAAIDAVPAGGVQSHRRPQEPRAELGSYLSGLPCEPGHDGRSSI
ncbi:MAG TPA: hypothetical protein VK493_01890 [Bryobacteraceae bacterium]|nr:hypothetical protein [Bryobacteraceae bacterium]